MTKTFDRIEAIPIRTRGLILVGAISAILIGMAGLEHIKRVTGQEIVLAARPVDPRDLLRGAYVTLDYEAERINTNELARPSDLGALKPGETLFVSLRKNEYDTWVPTAVAREKPKPADDEAFVRARVISSYDINPEAIEPFHAKSLNLEIGADRYFADEAAAKALEKANQDGGLKVVLSVDRSGAPVLKALIVDGKRRNETFF